MPENNDKEAVDVVKHTGSRYALVYLIAGSIYVALTLVVISMWLYNRSGAVQLDLSRPGHQDVRAKVEQPQNVDSFGSTGELTTEALDTFDGLYSEQIKRIDRDRNGFSPNKLSNEKLNVQVE